MVGWTVKDWTYSEIKVKIYSTMFLHSKERQITIFGSRLSEN